MSKSAAVQNPSLPKRCPIVQHRPLPADTCAGGCGAVVSCPPSLLSDQAVKIATSCPSPSLVGGWSPSFVPHVYLALRGWLVSAMQPRQDAFSCKSLAPKASASRVPWCAPVGSPALTWWRRLRSMARVGGRCYTTATWPGGSRPFDPQSVHDGTAPTVTSRPGFEPVPGRMRRYGGVAVRLRCHHRISFVSRGRPVCHSMFVR